jgi:hypothetical protein
VSPSVRTIYKNCHKYYALPDHTSYSIRISNNNDTRCDAEINIDEEFVGSWRLNSYSSATIRRPADIDRQFVFVNDTSFDAMSSNHGSYKNGLISVTFKPENYYYNTFQNRSMNCNECSMMSAVTDKGFDSGVTVLGSSSGQHFSEASPIYDYGRGVTINIRLIIDKQIHHHEPYMSLSDYSRISNDVPPPFHHDFSPFHHYFLDFHEW